MLAVGKLLPLQLHGHTIHLIRDSRFKFRILSEDKNKSFQIIFKRKFWGKWGQSSEKIKSSDLNNNFNQSNNTDNQTEELIESIKQEAPQLYDILNWPVTRIKNEPVVVKSTLYTFDNLYVQLLQKLYDQRRYSEVIGYFEKFGVYNNLSGISPSIYLSAKSTDTPEKINKFISLSFKPTSLGEVSNPMHIIFRSGRSYMIFTIIMALFWIILIFYILQNLRGAGGLNGILDSSYHTESTAETPVKFADVKGNHEAKEELKDIVYFLQNPQKFINVKIPKGVLMIGPPGTGKTLMARALAGEAGVPFLSASGSEFEEVFVGLGARRIRQLFEDAKKKAPCIIFIDEIDALGVSRASVMRNQQMSLNQLLVELDGFNTREGIILIGATNLPTELDPALVRPGRFDRKVYIELPKINERKEILDYYLNKYPLSPDIDSDLLSRQTPGMSGADIESMVNWAILEAIKDDKPALDMPLLELARMNVVIGREKKSMYLSEEAKKITAYHEGGHAIMALYTDGAPDINKATLIPRGQALGFVEQIMSDEPHMTKKELLARIKIAMAGRAAEELIFGPDKVTTGASSDFEMATKIAHRMVTKWGMSNQGHIHIPDPEDNIFSNSSKIFSEEVENEMKIILEDSYRTAKKTLKSKEKELHLLASGLLQYETLDKQDILKIIKGGKLPHRDDEQKREKEKKKLKEENDRKKEQADQMSRQAAEKEQKELKEILQRKQPTSNPKPDDTNFPKK